jgi:hypothetical protein
MMEDLWRHGHMMLHRILAEPRQMGTKIARRQRVNDFDGIRRWRRFRCKQTW